LTGLRGELRAASPGGDREGGSPTPQGPRVSRLPRESVWAAPLPAANPRPRSSPHGRYWFQLRHAARTPARCRGFAWLTLKMLDTAAPCTDRRSCARARVVVLCSSASSGAPLLMPVSAPPGQFTGKPASWSFVILRPALVVGRGIDFCEPGEGTPTASSMVVSGAGRPLSSWNTSTVA
jgi:hypothetical protein